MADESRFSARLTEGWNVRITHSHRVTCGRSRLARAVAGVFMDRSGRRSIYRRLYDRFELSIHPGEIVAVVGPSGSGKSVLLREVSRQVKDAVVIRQSGGGMLAAIDAIGRTGSDVLGEFGQRLDVLSRCGLAEATIMMTPQGQLSGGQAFRLALARALWRARRKWLRQGRPTLLITDEFSSSLDSLTAAVLCRQIRAVVSHWPVGMLLATPRVELLEPLQPDRVVVKPLGRPVEVVGGSAYRRRAGWNTKKQSRRRVRIDTSLSDPRRWPIRRGSIQEYRALGCFHYITGPPAAHKRVYVIRAPRSVSRWGGPDVAAVLVISPPLMNCRARNIATGGRYSRPRAGRREAVRLLNVEVESISRVVVHPQVRGCGLSVRLVRHALRSAGTPVVEALATMGRVHPFFKLAGMEEWIIAFGQRGLGRTGRAPKAYPYNYYLWFRSTGRRRNR